MNRRGLVFAVLLVSILAPAAFARGKKPAPTAPGTYKEWGQDIDQIEIIQTFKMADYDRIIVEPFDTSKTPLPDPKEKWYGTLKSALAASTEWFMEAFPKELKAKVIVDQAPAAPKKSRALILRGTIESMDPGSRAGRYFGGFGSGSASSKVSFDIVDARGKVLARVTQARRSAGTWKGAGGSDLEVMRDSIHAIAQDMAHVLDEF